MQFDLPAALESRLSRLPDNLNAHIARVRDIARGLAGVHQIDIELADLVAAAHDVARHLQGRQLIEEAERLNIPVGPLERFAPIVLHGPVGAAWLRAEDVLQSADQFEAVYWHTSAHPDLAPVGKLVFVADKIDPAKAKAHPFQDSVRKAVRNSLDEGVLAFLDGVIKEHVDHKRLVHPMSIEARNRLITEMAC